MSFSIAQHTEIHYYLGYKLFPLDTTVDAAITAVEGSDTRREEIIILLLEQLNVAESKVNSLLDTAGIKKIDELEFFPANMQSGGIGASQIDSRSYGRMLVKRLAFALGLDVANDVFQAVDRSVTASNKPARVII